MVLAQCGALVEWYWLNVGYWWNDTLGMALVENRRTER
jgi:hypothetical protein